MKGVAKADIEEAAKWVGGLDRIHRARGILTCYDFSATPFAPSGKRNSEEALFDWIVSDFGLNDAIESGLVKTPRVVVRDDALPDANARCRFGGSPDGEGLELSCIGPLRCSSGDLASCANALMGCLG